MGTDAAAQQAPGINRTDLQEHDLSIPGREVVQHRVEITAEAPAFRHSHPGEEVIYVIEGELEYEIEGEPNRKVKAGEALMVPAETVHAVTGVGVELATYVVEKDKPLITLAD
jgi:quercetin dioxygenase-like cupin family protein